MTMPKAAVFDVGRVIVQWDLRALFAKLIDDSQELDWFLSHVVTEEWHFQHDAGRPLDEMVPERIAEFPKYEAHIRAYASRFNETVPGPIAGTEALIRALHANGIPLFGITNFGAEFWAEFRPDWPVFDLFQDIIVSGEEKLVKPDPAIYALAERRFGLSGDALFFTDDNPANIDAATARGWHAHLFEGADGLEAELNRLNLI